MARRWLGVLRTPLGITAAVLSAAVVALAVLGPVIWGARAEEIDTDNILAGPSADHWAGTDSLGRDILFRVLVATRLGDLTVDVQQPLDQLGVLTEGGPRGDRLGGDGVAEAGEVLQADDRLREHVRCKRTVDDREALRDRVR